MGVRVGELFSIRIKDVSFDDYGMRVLVSGKTGVRVVRAIGYLNCQLPHLGI